MGRGSDYTIYSKENVREGAENGEVRLRCFALNNERFEQDVPIREGRDKDSGVKAVSNGKT